MHIALRHNFIHLFIQIKLSFQPYSNVFHFPGERNAIIPNECSSYNNLIVDVFRVEKNYFRFIWIEFWALNIHPVDDIFHTMSHISLQNIELKCSSAKYDVSNPHLRNTFSWDRTYVLKNCGPNTDPEPLSIVHSFSLAVFFA